MAFDNYGYSVGLRNVGSYQISGHPYITGSRLATDEEKFVAFPTVTRDFTVINSGSQGTGPVLRMHFNAAADGDVMLGHHYITLQVDDQAITFHTKCTGIFITCVENGGGDNGFEVLANLTGIKDTNMYALTGSGLTD